MKLVILESPYKGDNWEDTEENIRFGRLCMNDCLVNHNEAPFPSHLLYTLTGVLEDKIESERNLGIRGGFGWKARGDASVIYINRGISAGMYEGIRRSILLKQDFEYRLLPNYPIIFPRHRICTVTGASGAGKTTLIKRFLELRLGLRIIKSFTSRSRRDTDLPNEYRCNVPEEKFGKDWNRFLWVLSVHGNYYGTHKLSISAALKASAYSAWTSLMTLTPDAVKILREYLAKKVENVDNCLLSFYLLSPGEEELRKRLIERGDSKTSTRKRIKDCKEWDSEALNSDIPYIFIQNSEDRHKIAQQMSLFL